MSQRLFKRKRRAAKARFIIKQSGKPRICIHRTLKHFYAQLITTDDKGDKVLASISSLDKEVKKLNLTTNNVQRSKKLGELLAQRILALNIKQVALDRSGNRYHGRVKAFTESARTAGLEL